MPENRNYAEATLRDREVKSLYDALGTLPDRREEKNPRYPQNAVLTMLVYSTLSGFQGPYGAERYCRLHAPYFTDLLGLKRTPSAPVFIKVIQSLDTSETGAVLSSWAKGCSPDIREKYENLRAFRIHEERERRWMEQIEREIQEEEDELPVLETPKVQDERYSLISLLVMMVYCALCNIFPSEDMETYCNIHAAYFKKRLHLKSTPYQDTFDALKALIKSAALKGGIKACLTKALYEDESIGLPREEAGVIPDFLDSIQLEKAIVTIDASEATESVIQRIIRSGGDYVLPVRRNREKILEWCRYLEARNVLLDPDDVPGDLLKRKPYLATAQLAVLTENPQEPRVFLVSLPDFTREDLTLILRGLRHVETDRWSIDISLRESSEKHAADFEAMLRSMVKTLWKQWRKGSKNTLRSFLIQNQASMDNIEQVLQTSMRAK